MSVERHYAASRSVVAVVHDALVLDIGSGLGLADFAFGMQGLGSALIALESDPFTRKHILHF